MRVCVLGLWHLGSVTAAGLASLGHDVVGLEFDAANVACLSDGRPPLFEPGLEACIKAGISSGNLRFTALASEAVKEIDVLWVTYDTPVDDDDNADVDFVIKQIQSVIPELPVGTTVLISSQIPVGSVSRLEAIAAAKFADQRLDFAYSPENLRLGNALNIFLKPDRIIVGTRGDKARQRLNKLLMPVTEKIEWMSVESAEMTKHAINGFLATSVTYANEIAALCERVGADAKDVERGLKTESRIGPKAYLSPGAAFAGGTLARDIAFLNKLGTEKTLVTPLLASIKASNDAHKQWIKHRLNRLFPNLSQVKIAVWGLTYKPGTDTLRRSMAIELCIWLVSQGVRVAVHDPVVKALPVELEGKVERCDDALDILAGSQALVVATEWPQYLDISADEIHQVAPRLVLLDANRFLSNLMADDRLRYIGVGSPELQREREL